MQCAQITHQKCQTFLFQDWKAVKVFGIIHDVMRFSVHVKNDSEILVAGSIGLENNFKVNLIWHGGGVGDNFTHCDFELDFFKLYTRSLPRAFFMSDKNPQHLSSLNSNPKRMSEEGIPRVGKVQVC